MTGTSAAGAGVTTAPAGPAERPPLTAPRRVAVLRALPGLGDLLCAVPALRAIRATWPRAHVTLLGLPQATWFVQRYPDLVDDLLPVEGVGGLPEVRADPRRARRFLEAARERRFDLAFQAHGSGSTTNRLLAHVGAAHVVSAHVPGPGHWVPPGTSIRYPDAPEVVRLLRIVAAAGCQPRGTHIDLPGQPGEEEATRRLLDEAGVPPGGFACMHPGASVPSRRWPVERFVAIADRLARRGLTVVTTGSEGEQELTRSVIRCMARPDRARDLSGRTNVGTLAALYRQARLVVTNDTGASHVAAAVRAPSVVVTSSPDPWRWAPLDAARHVVLTYDRSAWRRTPWVVLSDTFQGGTDMSWPTVDAVAEAVDAQLARWSPVG